MNDTTKITSPADDSDVSTVNEESLKAIVDGEIAEAKAKNDAMPSPQTARLTYSAYADMKPCRESVYSPLGVRNYIGILLLSAIPVLGFVIAVIYALAAKNVARHRLAVAIVILKTILITLVVAAVLVMLFVFELDMLALAKTLFDTLLSSLG